MGIESPQGKRVNQRIIQRSSTVNVVRSLLPMILAAAVVVTGCDTSANRDLRRAEKLLKEADKYHAELWAEHEYRKAQSLFVEAMDLAKVKYVNEARDKAAECELWAQEAVDLARMRFFEMEKEKDRLGAYKP